MPHNTAQPAKVLLTCGICGRAFSCKYETLERRWQKGQWNPYCGPRCTNSALERYGRRPSGSQLVEEMRLSPKRQTPDLLAPAQLASEKASRCMRCARGAVPTLRWMPSRGNARAAGRTCTAPFVASLRVTKRPGKKLTALHRRKGRQRRWRPLPVASAARPLRARSPSCAASRSAAATVSSVPPAVPYNGDSPKRLSRRRPASAMGAVNPSRCSAQG